MNLPFTSLGIVDYFMEIERMTGDMIEILVEMVLLSIFDCPEMLHMPLKKEDTQDQREGIHL